MKLFPEEPEFIIGEAGFDSKDPSGLPLDILNRKPLGQKLTDLVDRIDQPLVIALDGGWGSGKSHFLKLWTGAHSKELGGKAEVIYFDAFEHDYLDDPLVSLVSRLTSDKAEKTWGEKAVSGLKKAAFPLAKIAARIGLASATFGATELAGAAADAAINKLSDVTDAAINDFWKAETTRIAAMQGFRDALKSLTGEGAAARKIVFIVDELDRCRPDYALSLLEIIKHFFAVPNVHFVLGVNLKELENSVRARYGAEIGATKYLQKFVHVSLAFPIDRDQTQSGTWTTYFDAISKKMASPQRERAKDLLNLYSSTHDIHLRDVQRFLTRLALLADDLHVSQNGYRLLGLSALVLQIFAPNEFAAMRANTMPVSSIVKAFPIPVPSNKSFRLAVRLQHLWKRALLDDIDDETKAETNDLFDLSFGDDRQAHFDRFWRDTFDVLRIPDGI